VRTCLFAVILIADASLQALLAWTLSGLDRSVPRDAVTCIVVAERM
jgi:hypothetical protein